MTLQMQLEFASHNSNLKENKIQIVQFISKVLQEDPDLSKFVKVDKPSLKAFQLGQVIKEEDEKIRGEIVTLCEILLTRCPSVTAFGLFGSDLEARDVL